MKLIVGLGNPGRSYEHNRHNLGFMCVSYFAKEHVIVFDKKQGNARIGLGEVAGQRIVVARPQTYMNQSGEAVGRLVKKFSVSFPDLIVIHDDLDLPVGKIRLRQGGSAGGHKGIGSIIAELGRPDFLRLRVGIGRPTGVAGSPEATEASIVSYVLSGFNAEEKPVISQTIPMVSEAILCLLTEGLTVAMNRYN
ncbi:MAG: peptidyl-tRNA hydrolase [Dehalococcoidales bacterium]|nr:peptidyl-tRNA hydrolase [Dehalococcoidales bacterium]